MSGPPTFPRVKHLLSRDGTEWDVVESLEEGKTSRSYYYKRQLAIRHELHSDLATRFAGLKLIEKDLRTLKSWVGLLSGLLRDMGLAKESQPSLLTSAMKQSPMILTARALVVAIVTTYGKLFTTADGRRTRLESRHVPAEHSKLHAHLLDMRNEFTAHAGCGHESCVTILAIDYAQEERVEPRIFTELYQPAFMGLPDAQEIELLVGALHDCAKRLLEKAGDALEKKVRQEFTPERLRFLRMGAPGTWLTLVTSPFTKP